MSATPSRQPSIELLQLASTSNLGYCIRVPPETSDKSMNVLLKEIGNTSNIHSIDATDADLFLIQNTPPITTATEQMEREIDIQDKRRRRETGKKSRNREKKFLSRQRQKPTKPILFYNPFQRSKNISTVLPADWMLHSFQNLTTISLQNCTRITDQSIRALVHTMPLLETINVSGCYKISDNAIQHLSSIYSLTYLNLSHCIQLTGDGLKPFYGTIEHLIVSGCINNDDEMVLGSIRTARNYGTKKCNAVLYDHAHVKNKRKQKHIRTFHIDGCIKVTDISVLNVRLQPLSTLTSLNMSGCTNITDVSLGRILAFLSAPLVSLDLSNMSNITNFSLLQLRENKSNKNVAGSNVGGKFRWMKKLCVQGSGVNSVDFLSWFCEYATELVTLGIGRTFEVYHTLPLLTSNEKQRIGKCISLLRRLKTLKLGDEHVEILLQDSINGLIVAPERVLSASLSQMQYLQYKNGEMSFTYKLPISHPENILDVVTVTTKQSSIPMGCEENRHSGIAINGILKGFYGDRVVDQMATTTITGLENQSWWEVDIGRREKIGVIKILLPEQHPPTFLLPDQFPFWIFCYRDSLPTGIVDEQEKCPSRSMFRYSVFSHRVVWNSSAKIGRSIHLKIPADVPSFRILKIQQETIDGRIEGRPLSLCEVQILPLRLQNIEHADANTVLVDSHLKQWNHHLQNSIYRTKEKHKKQQDKILKESTKNENITRSRQKLLHIRVRLAGLAAKYLNGKTGTIIGNVVEVVDKDKDQNDRVKVRLDGKDGTIVTVKRINTFDIRKTASQSRILRIFPKLAKSHGGIV